MTNRHAGFLVILQKDLREDDAQPTIEAIKQLRGVIDVVPVVSEPSLHIAESRAKMEMREKLYSALFKDK